MRGGRRQSATQFHPQLVPTNHHFGQIRQHHILWGGCQHPASRNHHIMGPAGTQISLDKIPPTPTATHLVPAAPSDGRPPCRPPNHLLLVPNARAPLPPPRPSLLAHARPRIRPSAPPGAGHPCPAGWAPPGLHAACGGGKRRIAWPPFVRKALSTSHTSDHRHVLFVGGGQPLRRRRLATTRGDRCRCLRRYFSSECVVASRRSRQHPA